MYTVHVKGRSHRSIIIVIINCFSTVTLHKIFVIFDFLLYCDFSNYSFLSIVYIITILLLMSFFYQCKSVVLTGVWMTASLLWSCRTLLSIQADINNAVVWMVNFVYNLLYSLQRHFFHRNVLRLFYSQQRRATRYEEKQLFSFTAYQPLLDYYMLKSKNIQMEHG